MKRFFAIIIASISFYACKPGIPKDVIQRDKMEKVLYDIHAVDGYIGTLSKPDSAKKVASSYYKGVYKKFDIDSATYTKSLNYYFNRPDLLNKMYENIGKQFEAERKRNDKRIDLENYAKQRIELAKKIKVLSYSSRSQPSYGALVNPFTFMQPELLIK